MLTDEGLIMKHKIYNINNKNDLGLSKKIWVQVISSFKIQLLFKIKTVNLKQGTKNEDFFFFDASFSYVNKCTELYYT